MRSGDEAAPPLAYGGDGGVRNQESERSGEQPVAAGEAGDAPYISCRVVACAGDKADGLAGGPEPVALAAQAAAAVGEAFGAAGEHEVGAADAEYVAVPGDAGADGTDGPAVDIQPRAVGAAEAVAFGDHFGARVDLAHELIKSNVHGAVAIRADSETAVREGELGAVFGTVDDSQRIVVLRDGTHARLSTTASRRSPLR